MNNNNTFTTLDFFTSLSATLGICTAQQWLNYCLSLDRYRAFDLELFFKYLTLGVKMQYSHQTYSVKNSNDLFRSIIIVTPNNAELKLKIKDFPGMELFEQRLLFCKVDLDLSKLIKLAGNEVKKQSDDEKSAPKK